MGLFKKILGREEEVKNAQRNAAWRRFPNEEALVQAIDQESYEKPVLIFKHSSRCSISATALARLERAWDESLQHAFIPYLLLVIEERPLSNAVARMADVEHQSPQLLLFKDGKCVYHSSHLAIDAESLKAFL
jgi:bacillithiol system protein YtxJ